MELGRSVTEEKAIAESIKRWARGVHCIVYSGACLTCSEIFFSMRRQRLYCSHKCHGLDRRGERHARWKGGRSKSGDYIIAYAPGHPRGYKGRVLEHILVMEKKLGRFMRPGENIHHKNGIRTDNRDENLEVWLTPQPSGQRPEDLINWVFDNYNKELRAKIEIQDLVRQVIERVSAPIGNGDGKNL